MEMRLLPTIVKKYGSSAVRANYKLHSRYSQTQIALNFQFQ
jgi:hypothetical protein